MRCFKVENGISIRRRTRNGDYQTIGFHRTAQTLKEFKAEHTEVLNNIEREFRKKDNAIKQITNAVRLYVAKI